MKRFITSLMASLVFVVAFAVDLPTWQNGKMWVVKVKKDYYPENYGLTPGYLSSRYGQYSFSKNTLSDLAKKEGYGTTNKALAQYLLDKSVDSFEEIPSVAVSGGNLHFYTGNLSRFFFVEARTDAYASYSTTYTEFPINPFKTNSGMASKNYCEWGVGVSDSNDNSVIGTQYWEQYFKSIDAPTGAYDALMKGDQLEFDHDCVNSLVRAHFMHMSVPEKDASGNWKPAVDMQNVTLFLFSPSKLKFSSTNSLASDSRLQFGLYTASLNGSGVDADGDNTKYVHTLNWNSKVSGWLGNKETFEVYKVVDGKKVGDPIYTGSNYNTVLTYDKGEELQTVTYQVVTKVTLSDGSTFTAETNTVTLPIPALDAENWVALEMTTKSKADDANRVNHVSSVLNWFVDPALTESKATESEHAKTSSDWFYDYYEYTKTVTTGVEFYLYKVGGSSPVATIAYELNKQSYSYVLPAQDYAYGAPNPNNAYYVVLKMKVDTYKCTYRKGKLTGDKSNFKETLTGSVPSTINSNTEVAPYLTTTFSATPVYHSEDANDPSKYRYIDNVEFGKVEDASLLYYEVIDGDQSTYPVLDRMNYDTPTRYFDRDIVDDVTNIKHYTYFGHLVTKDGSSWGVGPAVTTHDKNEELKTLNLKISNVAIEVDGEDYSVDATWATSWSRNNQLQGYEIYYRMDGETAYTLFGSSCEVTSSTDQSEVAKTTIPMDDDMVDKITAMGVATVDVKVVATDRYNFTAEDSKKASTFAVAQIGSVGSNIIDESVMYGVQLDVNAPGVSAPEGVAVSTKITLNFGSKSLELTPDAGEQELPVVCNLDDLDDAKMQATTTYVVDGVTTTVTSPVKTLAKETFEFSTDGVEVSEKAVLGRSVVRARVDWSAAIEGATVNGGNGNTAADYLGVISSYSVKAYQLVGGEEVALQISAVEESSVKKAPARSVPSDGLIIASDNSNVKVEITNLQGSAMTSEGVDIRFEVTPVYDVRDVENPQELVAGLGATFDANETEVATLSNDQNFSNKNLALGVDEIANGEISVVAGDGCITVAGSDAEVEIVNVAGITIYRGFDRTVNVESGIYVVRIEGFVTKVSVK